MKWSVSLTVLDEFKTVNLVWMMIHLNKRAEVEGIWKERMKSGKRRMKHLLSLSLLNPYTLKTTEYTFIISIILCLLISSQESESLSYFLCKLWAASGRKLQEVRSWTFHSNALPSSSVLFSTLPHLESFSYLHFTHLSILSLSFVATHNSLKSMYFCKYCSHIDTT